MARKLGEILVEKNWLSQEQLDIILKQQEVSGKPLGQLLLDTGSITSADLRRVYLEQMSEKYASVITKRNIVLMTDDIENLANLMLEHKTGKKAWEEWLDAHKKQGVLNKRTERAFTALSQSLKNCESGQPGAEFVPLVITDKELFIAVKPSSSLEIIFNDNLFNFYDLSTCSIAVYVVTDDEYSTLVDTYRNISESKDVYNAVVSTSDAIDRTKKSVEISAAMRVDLPRRGIDQEVRDARQLAFAMLAYVLNMPNVTDLHLFNTSNGVYFEYRTDGELVIEQERGFSPDMGKQVANVIMQLSGMNYTKRVPQDGQFEIDFRPTSGAPLHYFVRVASARSVHSIDAVDLYLRFLSSKNFDTSLEQLGYLSWQVDMLQKAVEKPYGIILITGPTGSGKSTTLYAMISHLLKRDDKLNILTVEDPVEYRLDGVKQYQIDEKAANAADRITFPAMLRAAMRMDPDVILIGEIRDKETLDIALNAALTGHLVFATLHANTAVLAIARALNMGAPPDILASVINVVIGQRLLRKKGQKGRQAVAEILDVNFNVKSAIAQRAEEIDLYRVAWQNGFKTMEEVAQEYIKLGLIAQDEVERVIGTEYRPLREQFMHEFAAPPTQQPVQPQPQVQQPVQPQPQVQQPAIEQTEPQVQQPIQQPVQPQPQAQQPTIEQTQPKPARPKQTEDDDPFSF